jgi:predicted dehydrogenase
MHIPAPEIINPQSVPSLRWGVIGPGRIADSFVQSSLKHTGQKFVAVASRTADKAQQFASKFNIPTVHKNYEELVSSDGIDAVYISSWQKDHFEHAMLALSAGKHVLVEKPITYLPEEAEQIFSLAKSKNLLAMEAMWTRYLPQSTIIRKLISEGDLGKPELFSASFCVDNRHIPRLWQKGGGGIIYDMGIYTIAMAQQFMGNPVNIIATGKVNQDELDEETHSVFQYAEGGRAQISSSGIATLPTTASCSFEKGVIVIDEPFFVPSGIKLRDKSLYFRQQSWRDESSIQGHEGLCYQAIWFAKFVEEGRVESPVHTAKDTVANIDTALEISKQVGARAF